MEARQDALQPFQSKSTSVDTLVQTRVDSLLLVRSEMLVVLGK